MNDVRLHVAPGTGLLVRRATELLFVPVDDAALVDVFAAARPSHGLGAVTAHAEEQGFAVGHFCVIDWTDRIRLALFGDIDVTSDHRSMPRLSASSSGTWIERTLRAEVARIDVAADHADPATDLQLGTITAGGFSLTAVAGAEPDDLADPPESRRGSQRPRGGAGGQVAPDSSAGSTPSPLLTTPVVPAAPLRDERGEGSTAPVDDLHDPGFLRPPGRRSAERVADSLLGNGPDLDTVAGKDDPTIDVPPHDGAAVAADTGLESGRASPSGTAAWRLRFDDGEVIEVDRTLVIGRRAELAPDDPRPARTVRFDCQQMSGRHLLVTPGDDEVRFTDLGSRNRSWVVTSGDQQLVALEPHVATTLGPGTHVQIGSKLFVVERSDETG